MPAPIIFSPAAWHRLVGNKEKGFVTPFFTHIQRKSLQVKGVANPFSIDTSPPLSPAPPSFCSDPRGRRGTGRRLGFMGISDDYPWGCGRASKRVFALMRGSVSFGYSGPLPKPAQRKVARQKTSTSFSRNPPAMRQSDQAAVAVSDRRAKAPDG